MFFVGIPQRAAASRLDAQARISLPSIVKRKKIFSRTTITIQIPRLQRTCGDTRTPPIAREVISLPLKYGSDRTPSPQRKSAASRIRIEMPIVMMIILKTVGLTSHRMKVISISAPTTIMIKTAPRIAPGRGTKPWRVTAVIPPSMTNSPWAKLIMPVVL